VFHLANASQTNSLSTSQGTFENRVNITADGELIKNPVIGPAKVGSLTTRTNNTQGVITLVTGHGLTTGKKDIYWTNVDGTKGSRYNVDGTISTDALTITGGAGDNLPALVSGAFAVTVQTPQVEPFAYAAAGIIGFVAACQYQACVVVVDGTGTPVVLVGAQIDGPLDSYIWTLASGVATPFSAATVNVYLSHAYPDGSAVVLANALIN